MTIDEFQAWTRSRDAAIGWDAVPLAQLACHLAEETGELVRSINRVYEYRGEVREQHTRNVAVELVDAAWFLFKIANRFGVSLESELSSFARREDAQPADKYKPQLACLLETFASEIAASKAAGSPAPEVAPPQG